MEKNEVSIHEVRIFAAMSDGKWRTVKEIAELSQTARRTAQHHATRYRDLGLVDVAEVYPAHRYRLSEMASKRNASYLKRVETARSVFGI